MPDYTIAAVSPETRPWKSEKWGEFIAYRIKLEGSDEVVELSQKTTTEAPTAGQSLDGEIVDNGEYGKKFKKAYQGGGSSDSSSPEREESMAQAGAFNAGVALAAAELQAGRITPEQVLSRVEYHTSALLPFRRNGVQPAGNAQAPAQGQSPDAPASSTQAQPGTDDDIPF